MSLQNGNENLTKIVHRFAEALVDLASKVLLCGILRDEIKHITNGSVEQMVYYLNELKGAGCGLW
eukprot:13484319-Ditylum_brightwellii.AAC.1